MSLLKNIARFAAYSALSLEALVGSVYGQTFFNPTTQHYYSLTKVETWQQAKDEAIASDGYLATINDQQENDWISNTFIPPFNYSDRLWIGFTDEITEGNFIWTNGENSPYFNWMNGEPNNSGGGEDYTVMFIGGDGRWNDERSDNIYQGVIESNNPFLFPSPTPSASPTASPSPTPSPSPTESPTFSPSQTPSPSLSPTQSPSPSPSQTLTSTFSPTSTVSPTPDPCINFQEILFPTSGSTMYIGSWYDIVWNGNGIGTVNLRM